MKKMFLKFINLHTERNSLDLLRKQCPTHCDCVSSTAPPADSSQREAREPRGIARPVEEAHRAKSFPQAILNGYLHILFVPSQIYNDIFNLFKNTSKYWNIPNCHLEFNISFKNKRKFIAVLYLNMNISLKGEISYFTSTRVAIIFFKK